MIDHVLGRPSVKFRKIQVLAVVSLWSAYLLKGNRHGPPIGRRLSSSLSKRLTTWQTLVITLLCLYVSRNFGKLVGLECPEPLANLYTRSYFRATWVTTALDAGFWSAMHIRRRWARDLLSVVFSFYYLIFAEQADEKVRKVRSVLTLDHLRVSWNKSVTPYLSLITKLARPRFMRYQPRAIRIPRPADSSCSDPVRGWLYFDGPISTLKKHTKVVLNIPGGGFVAMSPRTHDDSLFAWAGRTGLPVLSLDYQKAPEFPYPYALNECYDVYRTLVASRGRCIGLSGDEVPQVVVSGDSAGGNLAAALVLMIVQSGLTNHRQWHGEISLPVPVGLVLIYPALDVNIGNWMTDEQLSLIRDRRARTTNRAIIHRKNSEYKKLASRTLQHSDDDVDNPSPPAGHANAHAPATSALISSTLSDRNEGAVIPSDKSTQPLRTRLATPSLISYVSDRILTPEMMRAMIILYIGPHNRPDFSTDYLLSPVLAPDSLLARFPKTYFLTGERDPLVDDTVIMVGRIRRAKEERWRERQELGLLRGNDKKFDDKEHVEVRLIEGISHGFIQFGGIFPEAWKYIFLVGKWYEELFAAVDTSAARRERQELRDKQRHHQRRGTGASSGDEDRPLEIGGSLRLTKLDQRPATPFVEMDLAPGRSAEPTTPGAEGLAKEHPLTLRRSQSRRSMVSLSSEDDLLARRMRGLVGSLTRRSEVV